MEGFVRIQYCEDFGDYVVADKDFGAEELIFSEKPIYTLPKNCVAKQKNDYSCLGCLLVKPTPMRKCPKCLWPVCSIACSQEEEHSHLECKLFQDKRIFFQHEVYQYLKFIRVILSKEVFPRNYTKFMQLSSQFPNDDRGQLFKDKALRQSIDVFKFFTEVCEIYVTLEEIIKIRSILTINCFHNNISDDFGHVYRGDLAFAICCKFSHSCSPSAYWRFEKVINENKTVTWNMRVYTRSEIKKGEIVSLAYCHDGMDCGTGQRRQIQKAFPFRCLCSRCVDPTEGGTFFSSPMCANSKCPKGFMLPLEPLDSLDCEWQCQKCESVQSGSEINDKITEFEGFVRYQLSLPVTEHSLQHLDKFITKNSGKTLHKNHWLIFMSSEFWLIENDFTSQMVQKSKKSKKLFKKVMDRANRCLQVTKKFRSATNIANMELFVATTLAEYLFKSSDSSKSLNTSGMNLRKQLRYCSSILHHSLVSSKWLKIEDLDSSIDQFCDRWQKRCDILTGELIKYEGLIEETAFSQIPALFE